MEPGIQCCPKQEKSWIPGSACMKPQAAPE
jgi:hypothetical protein